MNIEEIKEMLDDNKRGLEMQRDTFVNRVLEKAHSISRLEPNKVHSQLINSMLRDIEIYADHLRDIESELKVVENYRWHTREE